MGEGAYIDKITLMHMNMEIDINQLMMNRNQGNYQLLAIFLIQLYYNDLIKKLGADSTTRHYKRRALDTAKFFAIQRLPELHSETEAGLHYLLDEAERTGWFHSDHFGYDSLDDLLANTIDPDTMSMGEVSDWKFIAKQVIPFARQRGIPPDQLLAATLQVKKLRGAVPTCRRILNDLETGDIKPEEAEKGIEAVVNWIADTKVTYTQFETNIGKREPPDVYRSINVYEVSLPKGVEDSLGHTWLVIPTFTETDKRIVEKQLNHRMNKKERHLPWLLEEITKYVPKGRDEGA